MFPAGEYRLGSPEFEGGELDGSNDEAPRVVRIGRPVALCDCEVSWSLCDLFAGGGFRKSLSSQFGCALSDKDAVMAGNLYDWAKFCRWLTHEWRGDDESWQCYPDPESPEEDGNGDPVYGDMLLDRGGFRMPTEAECQLAARSGQRTPYAFGGATSLLSDYGWFAENTENNRPCATGLKLPTIGGLFDAHGNMNEWAHDWYNVMDGKSVKEDPVGAWGAHRSLDRSLFRSLEMTPQGLGGANRIA